MTSTATHSTSRIRDRTKTRLIAVVLGLAIPGVLLGCGADERQETREFGQWFAQIRAATTLANSSAVPRHLASHQHLHVEDATHVRRFELSDDLEINGKRMDMNRIDEVVTAGSTELWEIHNRSPLPHNFHVHDVRFRIIDNGGSAPPPLGGLKDTVYVPPESTVRFVVRFGGYTDPETPYMFHCHLLWHEDHGMMGQFVVVERGRTSITRPQAHRSKHDHG